MHPLQQVHGHQVLEAGRPVRNRNPVVVVVLPRLPDRPDHGRAERRQPHDGVEPLENLQPAGHGPVAHRQVLTQRVDRQRRAHQIGQPDGQQLQRAQILDPLQVPDLLFDQTHAILARPPPGFVRRVGQVRFGEASQIEEPGESRGVGDAELGDRQRVQPQVMVAALQRVAAVAIEIESTAAGHENPRAVPPVVQSLEKGAPAVELVQLVESEHLHRRQTAAQDRVAMLRDVPAQVAGRVREHLARQGRLADLTRPRDEHHLPLEIGTDLIGQGAGKQGRHLLGSLWSEYFSVHVKIVAKFLEWM